jgi:hypothetical protein
MTHKRFAGENQTDALQSYYNQIRQSPLLSAEEEHALSRRIQAGDNDARTVLIESNLRLVVKIAKAYLTPDVSLLDLIQDGNLGLLPKERTLQHVCSVVDQTGDYAFPGQSAPGNSAASPEGRGAETDSAGV